MGYKIDIKQAVELYNSKFWLNMSDFDIAKFQLLVDKLCIPFDVFYLALERSLKRPVWVHELGLNRESLIRELLEGTPPPTFKEIIELLPKDKVQLFVIID